MSEDKPMTVKERMAALARASSGSSSAPAPVPSRKNPASSGTSVAERLAKMRQGGGERSSGGPSPGGSPKKVGLSRNVTPPGAGTTVTTKSPGGGQGGSSVADRIARLSQGGSSSSYPPSPSQRPAGTASDSNDAGNSVASKAATKGPGGWPAFTPALAQPPSDPVQVSNAESSTGVGGPGVYVSSDRAVPLPLPSAKEGESPRISAGLAARMQAMKMSSSSTSSNDETPAAPSVPPKSPGVAGRVSAGVAARMQALNNEPSVQEEQGPPPPPPLGGSTSSSRMSPGLAARMQALGGASTRSAGGSLSPRRSAGGGAAAGGGVASAKKMGGVSLPGMGMAIPMPGAMPPGGLAELKRRKQEAERAASEATVEEDVSTTAPDPVPEQKPGELQHANLSRATIPQRRRPRKAARPFKTTAAAAVPTVKRTPDPVTPAAPATVEPTNVAPPTVAPPNAPAMAKASPKGEKAIESVVVQESVTPPAGIASAAGKMNSMLQAAGAEVAGGEDDEEWE